MTDFEWQNEEDDSFWQEPPAPQEKDQAWIGWIMAILLLIGLVVGGWWLYQKITTQVDEVATQTEEDVRASFKLLYEVAEKRDGDLFNTLLSGRDQGWTAVQQQMMMTDGLLNRSVLGFDLPSPYPQISKLSLSPTLLSAEITALISYKLYVGNEFHETVQLELPVIYRKGDTRWLYAPPEPDFWGEPVEITEGKISSLAPTRDLKLATELTRDLSDIMSQFCQNDPNFPCWSQIGLEFTTDPQIMLNWSRYPVSAESLARPKLPTPSLVGIPTNKAGYQMVLNSYAEQLFTPYLAHIAGYPSNVFDKDFFFTNIIEYQWVKLGLRASPLSQQHYKALWETVTSSSSYEISVQSMMLSSNSVIAFDLPYALVEFALDGGTGQPISLSEALLLDMSTLISWTNRSEFHQFLAEKGDLPIPEQTPVP